MYLNAVHTLEYSRHAHMESETFFLEKIYLLELDKEATVLMATSHLQKSFHWLSLQDKGL